MTWSSYFKIVSKTVNPILRGFSITNLKALRVCVCVCHHLYLLHFLYFTLVSCFVWFLTNVSLIRFRTHSKKKQHMLWEHFNGSLQPNYHQHYGKCITNPSVKCTVLSDHLYKFFVDKKLCLTNKDPGVTLWGIPVLWDRWVAPMHYITTFNKEWWENVFVIY